MPLGGVFGCLELVLYGRRELAQQHHDLNQSEHSISTDLTNESAPLCSKGLGGVPLCPDTARGRVSTAVTGSIKRKISEKRTKMQNYLKDYLQNFRFHFVCLKRQICLINQRVRERNSPWSHFNKQQDSSPFNSLFHKGFVFVPYSLRIICIRWLATDEITALKIKTVPVLGTKSRISHGWLDSKYI